MKNKRGGAGSPSGTPSSSVGRNRRDVLHTLRPWRATSRGEIAALTGFSPATVSRLTSELVKTGVLCEVASARAGAGRPVRGLQICGERGAVLAISLLPPAAQVLIMNLRGDVIRDVNVPLDPSRGPAGLLDPVRKAVQGLVRKWPASAPALARVALALPGQWRPDDGVSVQFPRLPGWRDVPVRELLGQWTGRPVSLVSYAAALGLAEQGRRAELAPPNLLSVEVADHVAMGIIINGRVVQGASGNAGELGHITVDAGGPVCYCGNRGCLEMLVSCAAVEEEIRGSDVARRVFPDGKATRYEDVVARARDGDPFCARLLARVARTLGVGLAAALNLFNPELLVLSGRLLDAGDLIMVPLRASIADHALANTTRHLIIEPTKLGTHAAALGAGAVAIEEAVRSL